MDDSIYRNEAHENDKKMERTYMSITLKHYNQIRKTSQFIRSLGSLLLVYIRHIMRKNERDKEIEIDRQREGER